MHAALLLAVVMISLAVLYAVLEAPFLFAVQIIVYTGAILMLFLFVLMLVGVDASDSVVETIKGQRLLADRRRAAARHAARHRADPDRPRSVVGLAEANAEGNIQGIANVLFSRWVLAFEVTSALLITAAVGAMVLAHRERLTPRETQSGQAARRIRDFGERGAHPGPLPAPGVFARSNAVDTAALLPDGSPAESSVSRVLAARGTVRAARADAVDDVVRQVEGPDQAPRYADRSDAPRDGEQQ